MKGMASRMAYLMLLITQECNLNCLYCYLKHSRPSGSMDRELIAEAVRMLARSGSGRVHVQITGGEPTIYPELVEYTLKSVRSIVPQASVGLQTNCTLMDRSLAEILRKYNVQVGVSIDGLEDVHNKFRGKFGDTLNGLKLLDESGVEFRVTCVVYRDNVCKLDRLLLFLSTFRNFRGINLDLMTEKDRDGSQPGRAGAKELHKGLVKFLKALDWVNLSRTIPITFRQYEMVIGKRKLKCPVMEFGSIALCPDGRVYPCTHLVGDERFYCGQFNNIDYSPFEFLVSAISDCGCNSSACSVFAKCPGECPARLYYNTKNCSTNHTQESPGCLLYRTLWEHYEHV